MVLGSMCAGFVRHDDAVGWRFHVGCVCRHLFSCMGTCTCFRACVLGLCVSVSWIRDVDVATDMLGSCVHSRSLLKKKWSDARTAWNFWIHE